MTVPELLSVRGIAKATDLDPKVVRREIATGRLRGVTLDGLQVVRVRRSDFEAWVALWRSVDGPIRPPRRKKGVA